MSLAQEQRQELVTTLRALSDEQWRAETRCAGWDAEDLVAHMVVREREPLSAAGLVLGGPFTARLEHRMAARRGRGRQALLDTLAAGPTWWMSAGPLAVSQAVEDWIHHEDVRRGGAGLPPRDTAPMMADPLWQAALRFGRVTLARTQLDGPVVVLLTDGTRAQAIRIGTGRLARRTDAAPDVTVSGPAGELALFASGRPAAVEMSGENPVRRALTAASRGI